jgi:hypothetical protein
VYVHCHHGKHRGPAAAALLRMTRDGITNEEAVQGLETSETSPKYKGLFRDVRAFRAPSAESLAQVGALPSRVMPAGLRAVMVDVSQRFEALKLSRAADWKKPADHPDVDPPHEARMLWELYRELSRTDTAAREKGDAFLATLKTSEEAAIALEEALRAGDAKAAGVHFLEVQNLCSRCHETHRD